MLCVLLRCFDKGAWVTDLGCWRYLLIEKNSDVSVKLTALGDEMREKSVKPF